MRLGPRLARLERGLPSPNALAVRRALGGDDSLLKSLIAEGEVSLPELLELLPHEYAAALVAYLRERLAESV